MCCPSFGFAGKELPIGWCHIALYIVECILTLLPTYLFLQLVQAVPVRLGATDAKGKVVGGGR